ncbi:MAG: hypothetical protein NTW25_02540 [Candidatus Kapabacteria bacterium]|nr:hypothetical protein [Candidatus Kapabacteria bacterium]
MKKFSRRAVLLLVILTFLFSVSLEKAEAQCASGYTYTTVTVPYGTCSYIVGICFKCGASSNSFDFEIISITPNNSACYSTLLAYFASFITYANSYILENYSHSLCTVPPCNQGFDGYAEVRTQMCWKKFNNNGSIDLVKCDGAYCRRSYRTCWNYTTQRVQSTLIQTSLIGEIDCTSEEPIDPTIYGTYSAWCWNPPLITCQ